VKPAEEALPEKQASFPSFGAGDSLSRGPSVNADLSAFGRVGSMLKADIKDLISEK